jgi:hypothetical protein
LEHSIIRLSLQSVKEAVFAEKISIGKTMRKNQTNGRGVIEKERPGGDYSLPGRGCL